MINNLRRGAVLEQLPELPDSVTVADPFDEYLLSMAIVSDADYLVTGDHRAGLLGLGHVGRTRILAPIAFLSAISID